MKTFADRIISFYATLTPPPGLPAGIEILYPQASKEVMNVVDKFYKKYFSDQQPRHLIFGINPGRFGAGTTGINFTAPKQLSAFCEIDHGFKTQTELSAEFIYEMITAFGGAEFFYKNYFISSISPLGFTKDGVNMNYYDDPVLLKKLEPFIVSSIKTQLEFGFKTDKVFCIGGDKNLKYFSRLNDQYRFFDQIIGLPHPRFIMQYRRKQKEKFISDYLRVLS